MTDCVGLTEMHGRLSITVGLLISMMLRWISFGVNPIFWRYKLFAHLRGDRSVGC